MGKINFVEELIPDTPCKLQYFEKIKLFNLVMNKVVLDIGCGTGSFTHLLSKTARKVYGLDIAKENIEFCQKAGIKANFLVADAFKMPFKDSSMDFVFCSEVLEHIGNYKRGLAEINRVLKPRGFLLLTFPIQPLLPTTRFLYNATDKFNEWYYGKEHPQVHKEKLNLNQVIRELEKMKYVIIQKGKIRNTLATLICETFILFEKLLRTLRFGKKGKSFQLASQTENLNLPIVKLWGSFGIPFIKILMKIDSFFDGFDSSCGVILAKKLK